jgi:hypothetical protein
MNRIEVGLPIDSKTLREELPDGFEIYDTGEQYFEFDDSGFSLFVFTVSWAASIPANIIASLIYDAIKKRSQKTTKRIIIDEIHVELDRRKVTKLIQRRIEYQEGDSKKRERQ